MGYPSLGLAQYGLAVAMQLSPQMTRDQLARLSLQLWHEGCVPQSKTFGVG